MTRLPSNASIEPRKTYALTLGGAVILGLCAAVLHAQTSVCIAPGCNSVASDGAENTGAGTGALLGTEASSNSAFNTAVGYETLASNSGVDNTAVGALALQSNKMAGQNTALGSSALKSNTTGISNTAIGGSTLELNTTGSRNVAIGDTAFVGNSVGSDNSAIGFEAMFANKTGNQNSAIGSQAMEGYETGTGSGNSALGYRALIKIVAGSNNSALGASALEGILSGEQNTAAGAFSLYGNGGNYNAALGYKALGYSPVYVSSNDNTAVGWSALVENYSGTGNTAMGYRAMYGGVTGDLNTAVGSDTLWNLFAGSGNIAVGANAGYYTTASNNIDIGSMGAGYEGGVIRIGTPSSHTAVYVAGITSAHLSGSPVYVSSTGKIGLLASSERYKTNITSLDDLSERLLQLRPVEYRLNGDTRAGIQYGLIAEEVDQVLPALVTRDESGKVQGVQYDELVPLLVMALQRQHEEITTLERRSAEIEALREKMDEMLAVTQTLQAALETPSENAKVAMR